MVESKAGVKASVRVEAARAVRELRARARPHGGEFDASRYFRTTDRLAFLNVGTPAVRQLGKTIAREHRDDWTVDDALALADILIRDRHLEVKGVGLEALACFRRQFSRRHLPMWKAWLARNDSANWATTDAICGVLIGPLLLAHPELVATVVGWVGHRNMWVRRASAVALVPLARKGMAHDAVFATAAALHGDREDLIQKAVGWLLREAGRTEHGRLERYLRANGSSIPRTTLRYAIERFPPAKRLQLLKSTRQTTT
jgi:3-methyladenine DNA glycosylase AlkD